MFTSSLLASTVALIITLVVVGIFVLLLVILIGWVIAMYNGLIRKRVQCENSWSQIDVQLKRRYDLIPNLVETVKGYASHEREALEAVIKARQQCIDVSGVKDQAEAENMLSQTLRSLFAVSEAYPDLKANQNFADLQEELTSTENRISFSRQSYNDTVTRYNTAMQVFPGSMVAGIFNFELRDFFELENREEKEAPKVSF